jgi:hypothetical protein
VVPYRDGLTGVHHHAQSLLEVGCHEGLKTARIAEVLDLKGLKKAMNKTGHSKGLTHSGRE